MNASFPLSQRIGRRIGLPLLGAFALALLGAIAPAASAQPSIITDHSAYLPSENIVVSFKNGPANKKDWIGIYPEGVIPPAQNSIRWVYTDAAGGNTGLTEGTVTFAGGLPLAGDYEVHLLLNDGYTIAATAKFSVVDPSSTVVRADKRIYATGGAINVNFANGPAMPKDWIGIYPAGVTPDGDPPATLWFYTDGTRSGTTGKAEGTVTFPTGLATAGEYVVFFLSNDTYEILASEAISVVQAATDVPRILSISPANNATGTPPSIRFRAAITNATTRVVLSTIALAIDGAPVTADVQQTDELVTVTYNGTALLAPESEHTYKLTFNDDGTPPTTITREGRFTVVAYRNIVLHTPIVFENFDSTPEGQLPTGWSEVNFTEIGNPEVDLQNLDSASYGTWTVVNVDRFKGTFVTYSNPDNPDAWETDYQRVLTSNPANVVNGQYIENLAQGRMLFGNSGYRNGRSQVLYAFTPDFNLTGKTDINVAFHSVWEQNQDSIGAVEYSIDGGTTWLPIVYMIDGPDIVRDGSGNIDAVATFTTERGDIARYTDPITAEEKGGTYGSFIGATVSAELAPFISSRVDNDPQESKRVELFRLPQADNQAAVRFRFAHAGTDSWYFGVDNFGIYSIPAVAPPTIATAPKDTTVFEGDAAVVSVTAGGAGPFTYQWHFKGAPIANATATQLTIPAARSSDAGSYFVRVGNASGTTDSSAAILTVTPLPGVVTGVWQFESDLALAGGAGQLAYADGEVTQGLTTFATTDGNAVPHINGQPAKFMHVPAFTSRLNGYHLTMPTQPVGAEGSVNRYTFVWDVLLPTDVNWTPFFNTNPGNPSGNDADFYVSDVGALGIGALGYSANGLVQAGTWYRVAFAANLVSGTVTYYVNGDPVRTRTGASLAEGRFALYSDRDAGPDVLLFNEPSGSYTHEMLVNSMLFTSRAMSADEIKALGGPTAAGIPVPVVVDPLKISTVTRSGGDVTFTWTGGTGPFQVQKKTALTDAQWQNVGTATDARTFTETIAGNTGFYQVIGR